MRPTLRERNATLLATILFLCGFTPPSLSAQPLLNLVDDFRGVPFTDATHLALSPASLGPRLIPIGPENSGILGFFDDDNWEMLGKVLDGWAINDRVWVFAAATTDVATLLTVTDRVTGEQRVYEKPLGVAAPAVTDTATFAACDGS